jgi:ring-1,2-phenylacetyl-CoA epoxidase subunit PaaC
MKTASVNISTESLFSYVLHLADNALILGQRNAEWCGHGPVLEQDIAITNISLDLIGQARNFYQYAADLFNCLDKDGKQPADRLLPRPWKSFERELTEDDLAFLRDERQYLNVLITELPKGDWAQTVLKQFFFSAFQFFQYSALQNSVDDRIAGIAEKSLKETAYHLRWSSEWVIRLGDGTEESRRRIETAIRDQWPYTGEFFKPATFEIQSGSEGFGVDPSSLKEPWMQKVQQVFSEASLDQPKEGWAQSGGKEGKHTEHLGFLLAEMQYLQRTYPNSTW